MSNRIGDRDETYGTLYLIRRVLNDILTEKLRSVMKLVNQVSTVLSRPIDFSYLTMIPRLRVSKAEERSSRFRWTLRFCLERITGS